MSPSNTAHIMSCTKKGCTRCEPEPQESTETKEADDDYRIRSGFVRVKR